MTPWFAKWSAAFGFYVVCDNLYMFPLVEVGSVHFIACRFKIGHTSYYMIFFYIFVQLPRLIIDDIELKNWFRRALF